MCAEVPNTMSEKKVAVARAHWLFTSYHNMRNDIHSTANRTKVTMENAIALGLCGSKGHWGGWKGGRVDT